MSQPSRDLAQRANADLATATAEQILAWAAETFGDRLVVAASMADTVLVHLAGQAAPGIDVIFLDTGYHFSETLATRDRVEAAYEIRLHSVTPRQSIAEQDADHGPQLYERDPDLCCQLRKVEPLTRALDQSPQENSPAAAAGPRSRKTNAGCMDARLDDQGSMTRVR